MAAATITFYNNWYEAIGREVDLDAPPTIKVTLHSSSYTPNAATHTVYADLSNELATASGYTNGGQALAGGVWAQSGASAAFDANNVVWTASGGSITARYAVLRLVGTFDSAVDPLIAYILLDSAPADVTATDGNTLTLTWHASGIFGVS